MPPEPNTRHEDFNDRIQTINALMQDVHNSILRAALNGRMNIGIKADCQTKLKSAIETILAL